MNTPCSTVYHTGGTTQETAGNDCLQHRSSTAVGMVVRIQDSDGPQRVSCSAICKYKTPETGCCESAFFGDYQYSRSQKQKDLPPIPSTAKFTSSLYSTSHEAYRSEAKATNAFLTSESDGSVIVSQFNHEKEESLINISYRTFC
jgi:hypothetical protein